MGTGDDIADDAATAHPVHNHPDGLFRPDDGSPSRLPIGWLVSAFAFAFLPLVLRFSMQQVGVEPSWPTRISIGAFSMLAAGVCVVACLRGASTPESSD